MAILFAVSAKSEMPPYSSPHPSASLTPSPQGEGNRFFDFAQNDTEQATPVKYRFPVYPEEVFYPSLSAKRQINDDLSKRSASKDLITANKNPEKFALLRVFLFKKRCFYQKNVVS